MKKKTVCLVCGNAVRGTRFYFCSLYCQANYGLKMAEQYDWCERHGWYCGSGCPPCSLELVEKKKGS